MYKLLLCWRYLRTRYIALASIISVTLGVATMIVVNSVMAGFNREMQERIHGILSDVVFESHNLNGFHDPEWHMGEIRRIAGDNVVGMTPTIIVPAMLSFQVRGQWVTRQINFIGIEEQTHSQVSDFSRFLQHPANREKLSFELRPEGYDVVDHQMGADGLQRPQMKLAGWRHRRLVAEERKRFERVISPDRDGPPPRSSDPLGPDGPSSADQQAGGEADRDMEESATEQSATEQIHSEHGPTEQGSPEQGATEQIASEQNTTEQPIAASEVATDPGPEVADDVFNRFALSPPENVFDSATDQHVGVLLGIALASYRSENGKEGFLVVPGDDVKITLPTAGQPPKAVTDNFTVVDFYESKMSEYDSGFVFVPLKKLQQLRGMVDPSTGIGNVTSIQIKLRPGANGDEVCRKLRGAFPPELYGVQTWRDKQGPLLAAVQMETAILNVLLFLIIAVAGFGILAIFFMIVVEKTRDIGILKSLGASGGGIMGIFLTYGLSLGLVGSGAGLVIGLLFVMYINQIAKLLGSITGREVFDPAIYYFQQIPTLVDPFTVTWIVVGAMLIAIVASILPARRAARLHPVEALRYE